MKKPIKAGKADSTGLIPYPSVPFILLLSATPFAQAGVAQAPLFLTTNVKPNIMLMVDNSGSMSSDVEVTGEGTTYNPNTTYLSGLCTYNSDRDRNRAMNNDPSDDYTTSVPSRFLGNGSGSRCFDPNRTYPNSIFNSTMLALITAAGADTNAKKTNFLNWYYSNQLAISGTTQTRLQIAKDAANNLVDSLSNNVRMGFATFTLDTGGRLLEVIDDLSDTKKTNIKSRINSLSADNWTPLAETQSSIARYFATGYTGNLKLHPGGSNEASHSVSDIFLNNMSNGTGWRTATTTEPTFTTAPIQYSCQKSFSVLITDGLPTQDRSISSYLQDYDGDCTNVATGVCTSNDMKAAYPYTPNSDASDFLDDVSQAMYEMDFRPDLTKTGGAKNNITTYTIGLADPDLDPNTPGNNPILKNAALKGGGSFYFAGNATELTQSLVSAFNFMAEQSSSSSSVATNSTQFQTDTLIYQALFDSNNWGGKLVALQLISEDLDGDGIKDTGEDVNNNGKLDSGMIGPQKWDASDKIPEAADRRIYTFNPAATSNKGIPFLWANLNTTQKQALDTSNTSAASSPVLNYLRGDQSNEGSGVTNYRSRPSVLGDIVNSDPLFIGYDDLGYSSLSGTEGSSYTTFRNSTAYKTRRAMIYAGANDGMLHGFDATSGTDGGKEIFAFVPNAVISTELAGLTNQNYIHRYFVDGSAQYGDAYFNSGWHTVLVGSMGAGSTTELSGATGLPSGTGGRSLFALDVTNPDDFANATTAASKILWEFSSRHTAVTNPADAVGNFDDSDLGYTMPQPGIVRMMANGKWAAIVANGYSSASGKAVLFILDIQTGAIIKKIQAETTTGTNGLSSPVAVDSDNDKIVDYIYAGDLNGNLWKFDVSSSDSANWGVAYSGSPLFVAQDRATTPARQAITSKLAINKAAGTGQSSGVMIYFGTGKYFETGDNVVPTSPQVQSFYAIWDICDKTSATTCNGSVSGRSVLQEQKILVEGSNGSTTIAGGITIPWDLRVTSNCQVGFGTTAPTTTTSPCTNAINRRGWYLDLLPPTGTASAERSVSTPILRNGRVIFTTLIPNNTTCTPGGTSWLMELDQNTGTRLTGTPFDINNDGKVDDSDMALLNNSPTSASGLKSKVGIIDSPAIVACEDGLDCKYASGSSGELMTVRESAPTGGNRGGGGGTGSGKRISWRQLR